MNPKAPGDAPLRALERVLLSIEALYDLRALSLLLGCWTAAGLLLSMASASLLREATQLAAVQALASFLVGLYGANATGLLLMDQTRGALERDVGDALRDALRVTARLLGVLGVALAGVLVVGTVLALLLWLARAELLGVRAGALLFGLVMPLGVVVCGVLLLALSTVVAPLAAAGVWAGLDVRATLRLVGQQLRTRPLFVLLLTSAATLLAGGVAALVAAVVVGGGRVMALGAVLVTGVELSPQQLLAGLFGQGLRQLGPPVAQSPYGVAAVTGGGVVFIVGVVLPVLVYLRALCVVLLQVRPDLLPPAPLPPAVDQDV